MVVGGLLWFKSPMNGEAVRVSGDRKVTGDEVEAEAEAEVPKCCDRCGSSAELRGFLNMDHSVELNPVGFPSAAAGLSVRYLSGSFCC